MPFLRSPSGNAEDVVALPQLLVAGGAGSDSKKVSKTGQIVSAVIGGKLRGPTDKERYMAGCFKKALLLPAVMIA